jgi:peptidoglycan/LPS O-acetylase OafA/YrhL
LNKNGQKGKELVAEAPRIKSLDLGAADELRFTPALSPARSRPGRVPELDGLRGTAILMVVLFHYMEQQGAVAGGGLTPILQRLVLMGWSGVDLFFVLSGFLIGGILVDARNSPSYFKTFYMRRLFRIIPIYYLWILAYIVLIGFAGSYLRAHSNSGVIMAAGAPIYAHFLFLQNLMVIPFAGLAGAWFSHLWSLAVEEQFYLVSPLLVRLFSTRLLMIFLVCVIAAAPLLRTALLAGRTDPWLVSVLMPCRADSLAIGMLAALCWREEGFREWLSAQSTGLYAILAMLFSGVAALWKWSPESLTPAMETIGFTWLAAFYVVILLLALTRRDGPIARLMRLNWLRELGKISYCVYIIHLVVNVACHSLLRSASPATSDWRGAAVTVFAAFATVAIAAISWKVLEGPLVRLGHSFQYRPAARPEMAAGAP